jgi:hypothetical protein
VPLENQQNYWVLTLDIKTARAEKRNLTDTTAAISAALAEAKEEHSFIVVFVTGIPGAGKTLCGLDAVFSADTEAAFLTGTLPMVYVLKEALAQDAVTGLKGSKSAARHKTKSKIQSITGFLKDHRDRVDAPVEHLIVFDEAQRAWSAEYGAQQFNLWDSEAGIVLDIMNRHTDYAVIVGLVGNGQEINTGEAGLSEWGNALSKRPQWKIRAARNVVETLEHRQRLFDVPPPNIDFDHNLHLNVAIRHIRSAGAAPWVDAVLRGVPGEAASIAGAETEGVPFFITRQLTAMRKELRARMGGSRRAGLVCSSGAKRLVADGLWPNFDHMDESNVANWFLKNWPPDVRSSKALEIPATEFACQGLELDYVGLCWGGDFSFTDRWIVRKFSGSKWQYPKKQDTLDFCRNTYRVLLTRARYDTIIWIPEGDPTDPTREPGLFDQTAAYLLQCGATMLQDVPLPLPEAVPALLYPLKHHDTLDIF